MKRATRLRRIDWARVLAASAIITIATAGWRETRGYAAGPALSWTEDFSDDPLADGRFSVPPGHNPSRFTYDGANQQLVTHYNTGLPTAWYVRPLDPVGDRVLGPCDDFEFTVTFRIRSAGFFADPFHFAELGWGFINTQTTGPDRSGGKGPYAYDVVSFDFFPNVSQFFGGPNLGPTIIHSDTGQGFFGSIEFSFGAETRIDTRAGDQPPALDTTYVARVMYSSQSKTATLTIAQGPQFLNINVDGAGGAGGLDGDAATIQTVMYQDLPFSVNAFTLLAWHDASSPTSSVIADIEIKHIAVSAAALLPGDLDRDSSVDGRDIGAFCEFVLAGAADSCTLERGDFSNDDQLTLDDLPGFVEELLGN